MADRDEAWASCRADHVAEQRFAIFNRALAEIVAVEVVEGEISELVVSAQAQRLGELVD